MTSFGPSDPDFPAGSGREADGFGNGPGVRVGDVPRAFDPRIDGLLSGVKWLGATITYSDPDRTRDYPLRFVEPLSDFQQINLGQLATVRAILENFGLPAALAGFSIAGFTQADLRYVGGASGLATLRFANTSDPETAYAYLPDADPVGGDVFFGPSGRFPVLGGYDHLTILHETGHAFGLKHGHERELFPPLPFQRDSMEFSVMTYRSFIGADAEAGYPNRRNDFAQSYMMSDIAALQHMYGADYATNAGDTVYSWSPTTGRTVVDGVAAPAPSANRIFLTIWDGGGIDTYDLSAYRSDLAVDLTAGGHSTFGRGQLAYLGGGPNEGYARGNVFNALLHRDDPRSLIENAIGGWGDDLIGGNAAANRLSGGGGADRLRGFDADDALLGGLGDDLLFGGAGDDVLQGGRGANLLDGGQGSDTAEYDRFLVGGSINLAAGTARFPGAYGARDRLVSIENAVGGAGADALIGDGGANLMRGGAGRTGSTDEAALM